MLKYWTEETKYWQRFWRSDIVSLRRFINVQIKDSPSLVAELKENFESMVKDAIDCAAVDPDYDIPTRRMTTIRELKGHIEFKAMNSNHSRCNTWQ